MKIITLTAVYLSVLTSCKTNSTSSAGLASTQESASSDCGYSFKDVNIPRLDQVPFGPQQLLDPFVLNFNLETQGFKFRSWELNVRDSYIRSVKHDILFGDSPVTIHFNESKSGLFSSTYPAATALTSLKSDLEEMKHYWEVNPTTKTRLNAVIACAETKIQRAFEKIPHN